MLFNKKIFVIDTTCTAPPLYSNQCIFNPAQPGVGYNIGYEVNITGPSIPCQIGQRLKYTCQQDKTWNHGCER